MILQSALRGWSSKGRKQSEEEALESLRREREETQNKLRKIISQLDGEDKWFMENMDQLEKGCSCGAEDEY